MDDSLTQSLRVVVVVVVIGVGAQSTSGGRGQDIFDRKICMKN